MIHDPLYQWETVDPVILTATIPIPIPIIPWSLHRYGIIGYESLWLRLMMVMMTTTMPPPPAKNFYSRTPRLVTNVPAISRRSTYD